MKVGWMTQAECLQVRKGACPRSSDFGLGAGAGPLPDPELIGTSAGVLKLKGFQGPDRLQIRSPKSNERGQAPFLTLS
jgi:hypothetical protein